MQVNGVDHSVSRSRMSELVGEVSVMMIGHSSGCFNSSAPAGSEKLSSVGC